MAPVVVQLSHISKSFGQQQALTDFSLTIEDGEFITLLGPSGCGKTTVLRLIGGFEQADTGEILLDGNSVLEQSPEHRPVNTVFQNYALFPHMSVFDNIAFGLCMAGKSEEEIGRTVHEALRLVRLDDMGKRKPAMLSGGQQQRVAIARAIVNKPRVLLLDEPLSALDYRLRKEMQKELKDLHRQLGITFILVTHDQDEAFTMSDRVVVMNHGRIEQIGSPRQVYEEPINLYVAKFVGEINILDGIIHGRENDRYLVEVEGCLLPVNSLREFAAGDPVHILLRPEDIYLDIIGMAGNKKPPADQEKNSLSGRVSESYYRGATYDLLVELPSSKQLLVTEFFDEDAENVAYNAGDEVQVHWFAGWEVVLPHE